MNLGLAVWEWQEDGSDKKCMQQCRCGRSGTGCAKTWERWGSGLSLGKAPGKMAGNQSSDFRARRPREGDTWGTGKDQGEVIAVKISANTVRPIGVRQQGCNEKFWEDRQTGSARKWKGKSTAFSLIRNGRKRVWKKLQRDIQFAPSQRQNYLY